MAEEGLGPTSHIYLISFGKTSFLNSQYRPQYRWPSLNLPTGDFERCWYIAQPFVNCPIRSAGESK